MLISPRLKNGKSPGRKPKEPFLTAFRKVLNGKLHPIGEGCIKVVFAKGRPYLDQLLEPRLYHFVKSK
jgi:hypothetical protein